MRIPDHYCWQAIRADGSMFASGESLSDAVMVSLIPTSGLLLPRHDLTGLVFKRRFGRGFIHALAGGETFEYLHCIVTRHCRFYLRSSNGSVLITPPDYELYL